MERTPPAAVGGRQRVRQYTRTRSYLDSSSSDWSKWFCREREREREREMWDSFKNCSDLLQVINLGYIATSLSLFFKKHTHIQLLKQMFSDSFPSQSGRYPVAVVMITVPPADIDVNLEPNKMSVLLRNMVNSYYCYHNYTVDPTVCIQVIVARPWDAWLNATQSRSCNWPMHDPLSLLAYPLITNTHSSGSNLPIKTLVAR